jgi:hypothetical protein
MNVTSFQAAGPWASDEASLHIRVVEDLLFLSGLHGFHGFHWPKIDIRPLSTAKTMWFMDVPVHQLLGLRKNSNE